MSSAVDYEKLSCPALKEKLKSTGLSQSGEKGTLIWRLKLADKCRIKRLVTTDGVNPCQLKFAELKKAAARVGVSPIGSQDEVFEAFVNYLEKNPTASTSTSSAQNEQDIDVEATLIQEQASTTSISAHKQSTADNSTHAISIAQKVLELGSEDDYESILNLAAPDDTRITKSTSLSVMRKAYLKLSLIIHPDKIGRQFSQATKAFQELVKAFDHLSSVDVDLSGEEGGKGKAGDKSKGGKGSKVFTISRSNEGCYRTRVCCPRYVCCT